MVFGKVLNHIKVLVENHNNAEACEASEDLFATPSTVRVSCIPATVPLVLELWEIPGWAVRLALLICTSEGPLATFRYSSGAQSPYARPLPGSHLPGSRYRSLSLTLAGRTYTQAQM